MQVNKNGIRVEKRSKNLDKRKQRELAMQKLEMREFAEFEMVVEGIVVKMSLPNFRPLIKAAINDGWKFVGQSAGEIA